MCISIYSMLYLAGIPRACTHFKNLARAAGVGYWPPNSRIDLVRTGFSIEVGMAARSKAAGKARASACAFDIVYLFESTSMVLCRHSIMNTHCIYGCACRHLRSKQWRMRLQRP